MARSEQLMRVHLTRKVEAPDTHTLVEERMNVLVDYDPRVKRGVCITLKDSEDPDKRWLVESTGEVLNRIDIKVGWNNNI